MSARTITLRYHVSDRPPSNVVSRLSEPVARRKISLRHKVCNAKGNTMGTLSHPGWTGKARMQVDFDFSVIVYALEEMM